MATFNVNDFVEYTVFTGKYQGFITYIGKYGYSFTSCTPVALKCFSVYKESLSIRHVHNPFDCSTIEEFIEHYPEYLI